MSKKAPCFHASLNFHLLLPAYSYLKPSLCCTWARRHGSQLESESCSKTSLLVVFSIFKFWYSSVVLGMQWQRWGYHDVFLSVTWENKKVSLICLIQQSQTKQHIPVHLVLVDPFIVLTNTKNLHHRSGITYAAFWNKLVRPALLRVSCICNFFFF